MAKIKLIIEHEGRVTMEWRALDEKTAAEMFRRMRECAADVVEKETAKRSDDP